MGRIQTGQSNTGKDSVAGGADATRARVQSRPGPANTAKKTVKSAAVRGGSNYSGAPLTPGAKAAATSKPKPKKKGDGFNVNSTADWKGVGDALMGKSKALDHSMDNFVFNTVPGVAKSAYGDVVEGGNSLQDMQMRHRLRTMGAMEPIVGFGRDGKVVDVDGGAFRTELGDAADVGMGASWFAGTGGLARGLGAKAGSRFAKPAEEMAQSLVGSGGRQSAQHGSQSVYNPSGLHWSQGNSQAEAALANEIEMERAIQGLAQHFGSR